ncbi:MAG: fasciclin domain-containing protein [Myxococcota bacterium]
MTLGDIVESDAPCGTPREAACGAWCSSRCVRGCRWGRATSTAATPPWPPSATSGRRRELTRQSRRAGHLDAELDAGSGSGPPRPRRARRPFAPRPRRASPLGEGNRAQGSRGLDAFLGALQDAQLFNLFTTVGPNTLLAPTDDAFVALTVQVTLEALLDTMLGHLSFTNPPLIGAATADELAMMSGSVLPIDPGPPLRLGPAEVETPDIVAFNGVIHEIDRVLASEP